MSVIKVFARQIFDSRGNPTVEVDVYTKQGKFTSAVPSGASTGIHEAVELRDEIPGDYMGKGVSKAISNVNNILGPALIASKLKVTQQKEIDELLIKTDGTPNKGNLGANAILGISMAVCEAAAFQLGVPLYQRLADLAGVPAPYVLPLPCFNVINGGSHAGNSLAIQEFLILPTGAKTFHEAMKMATETYHNLKKVIQTKYGIDATNVGDEGGFAPNVSGAHEALDLLVVAIEKAGYTGKISIGFDSASSEFYKDGKYDMDFKNPSSDPSKWLTGEQLADHYNELQAKYPIVFIEDPFAEDDWESWAKFAVGNKKEIVGDDLLCTNVTRIKTAIEQKSCNALLLKLNQIGTITESIAATHLAQSSKWGVLTSHRSGETENTFIADLAVGLRTGHIKTGAPCRSERMAKYNRLLRIEEEITLATGKPAQFAAFDGLANGTTPPALYIV